MKIINYLSVIWLEMKYSIKKIALVCVLHTVVLLGMFLFNAPRSSHLTFAYQMENLPLMLAFFIELLIIQIILIVGRTKMDRKYSFLDKIPIHPRKVFICKWLYELVVILLAVAVHFITICIMFVLYSQIFAKDHYFYYELYSVFGRFKYLNNMIPVQNVVKLLIALGYYVLLSFTPSFYRIFYNDLSKGYKVEPIIFLSIFIDVGFALCVLSASTGFALIVLIILLWFSVDKFITLYKEIKA